MPRWLSRILERIHSSARQGDVRFTYKAVRELAALDLGLDETDVCEVLAELAAKDFRNRIVSSVADEYLYVFVPQIAGTDVYLKMAVRANCIVISFHEDQSDETKDGL